MNTKGAISRVVVLALLVVHALIHLIGPLGIWELAELPEMTGATIIDLAPTVADGLAFVWLAALVLFLLSAVGLFSRRPWWRWVALAAVLVSQAVVVVWWPDASAGTFANVLILTAVALAPTLDLPNGHA